MYEQVSHSLLNDILIDLKADTQQQSLRHFYTRLGANFYAIYSLFELLYGQRADFKVQLGQLVATLQRRYLERDAALKQSDLERERNHNWFLSQKWVAMALYCDRFAGTVNGLRDNLPYLQDLGINMIHVMPILDCPPDHNDGGYAVRDFHQIDARVGTIQDVEQLSATLRQRDMLLVLDVVVNHTSDQHQWALKARQGDAVYQDYYYTFADRNLPDQYEQCMPEVFPTTAPGNFTWSEEMQRWVMTVFNQYQWDLNYHNPAVLIEMVDIILFWANRGADVLRLDAVAFLWKKIGSSCQNEREAHLLLQLMKDCCQVVAPGVLFIAEAIVSPTEIAKYFGGDAINAKECEIAYNATLMALLWDAVATKNAVLLNLGIRNLPQKLERATWLNYVRCHDDIGLGFDDNDVRLAGYDPVAHRQFLVEYFTGDFASSSARGLPFGDNPKTGDTRISGSLASLVGLEAALERQDAAAIDQALAYILLLHKVILSFGGIPLFYYGDAIGTLNSLEYLADPAKSRDNRWVHRSFFNWQKAALRHQPGTIEQRIFEALKRMIARRKEISAFADFDNRQLLQIDNPHLLLLLHSDLLNHGKRVVVVANFHDQPQVLNTALLRSSGCLQQTHCYEICHNETLTISEQQLTIPALCCWWLADWMI